MEQTDGDGQESNCPSGVFPVDSDACIFPDSSLCMFTLLNNFVITLSQAHGKWWMKLHELPHPEQESPPYRQVSEVGFCPGPQPGDEGDGPPSRFLPVLCCASSPGTVGSGEGLWCSGGFVLEEPLFSLLFGIDAAMLESPMILCGFPDGQLCSVPLKALSASPAVDGCHDVSNQDPPVKILHHLEEPIVFIGALRTERRAAEDAEDEQLFGDAGCDCVVAVGHYGKMVAVKADQREEATVPELREYYLRGPILCAACGSGSRMYYSTHSDISAVDLDWVGDSSDPEDAESCTGVLPPVLSPASLSICSVVALSLSSRASEGTAGSGVCAGSWGGAGQDSCLFRPVRLHPSLRSRLGSVLHPFLLTPLVFVSRFCRACRLGLNARRTRSSGSSPPAHSSSPLGVAGSGRSAQVPTGCWQQPCLSPWAPRVSPERAGRRLTPELGSGILLSGPGAPARPLGACTHCALQPHGLGVRLPAPARAACGA